MSTAATNPRVVVILETLNTASADVPFTSSGIAFTASAETKSATGIASSALIFSSTALEIASALCSTISSSVGAFAAGVDVVGLDGIVDEQTMSNTFGAYAPFDNPSVSFVVVSPDIYYKEGSSTYRTQVNKTISYRISKKYFDLYK